MPVCRCDENPPLQKRARILTAIRAVKRPYNDGQNDECGTMRYSLFYPICVIIDLIEKGYIMAMEYTEEQLNTFDKATLVQLFLVQQSQLRDIDQKLQLLLEQVAVLNHKRFGKSSEKLDGASDQFYGGNWQHRLF